MSNICLGREQCSLHNCIYFDVVCKSHGIAVFARSFDWLLVPLCGFIAFCKQRETAFCWDSLCFSIETCISLWDFVGKSTYY